MSLTARITNTVHGMIAEKRSGTRHFHRHDPLGSVIGLVSDSATTTDTYTYWPYGTLQSSTGSTQQPWKFVGKYGYYTDSATHTYVRARKYRKDLGRWLTVDPLWPGQLAFVYVNANPATLFDPSGTQEEELLVAGVATSTVAEFVLGYFLICHFIDSCNHRTINCVPQPFFDVPPRRVPPTNHRIQPVELPKPKNIKRRRGSSMRRYDLPIGAPYRNPPGNPFCPKPCPPPVMDCDDNPEGRHYFAALQSCCYGPHCHYYVYHQGPPLACICRKEADGNGSCAGILVPGPCQKK